MAGKWDRIVDSDGCLSECDWEVIANYSEFDIVDTFKEMYGMIWSLAISMAGETKGPNDDPRRIALQHIGAAYADYEHGIQVGARRDKNSAAIATTLLRKLGYDTPRANQIVVALIEAGAIDPTRNVP